MPLVTSQGDQPVARPGARNALLDGSRRYGSRPMDPISFRTGNTLRARRRVAK